jgi:hypothetical protein
MNVADIPAGRTFKEIIRPGVVVYDPEKTSRFNQYQRWSQILMASVDDSAGGATIRAFVTFASPTLNTSLTSLINFKQAQSFAEQLNLNGITQDTYNNYNTQNKTLLAVLNDMFYTIQRWLAVYFGINFNTYSLDYVADPINPLPPMTQIFSIKSSKF